MLTISPRAAFTALLLAASLSAPPQLAIAQLGDPPVVRRPDVGKVDPKAQQEQMKQLNSARQATIKKDTDKLLQLATELKQSVDKSSANTLSMDVVKKAEQIEKLARAVKDKMKSGY